MINENMNSFYGEFETDNHIFESQVKKNNNFLIYKNIILGQTFKTFEVFKSVIDEFDTIIEIGFHRGGLSAWLNDNKNPRANLICYDITNEFLESKDNIDFRIANCFDENTVNEIKSLIQADGRTLVLCDGGNKELEFTIFTNFLKPNDVIMLHDYCDDYDYYRYISTIENWISAPESFLDNINPIIQGLNLSKFKYDEFRSVFWGSFIKSV